MLNFIFFLIHTFCFVLFGFKSIKKVWEWQKESENVVEEVQIHDRAKGTK